MKASPTVVCEAQQSWAELGREVSNAHHISWSCYPAATVTLETSIILTNIAMLLFPYQHSYHTPGCAKSGLLQLEVRYSQAFFGRSTFCGGNCDIWIPWYLIVLLFNQTQNYSQPDTPISVQNWLRECSNCWLLTKFKTKGEVISRQNRRYCW